MSSQLPGVFQSFAPTLDRYGYAAVVLLVGLEGIGIPLPGQIILIAAGIYAGAGELSLALVLIAGLLAAVCGDNSGYAIGRFGGRALVLRFGRYVFLTEKRLAATERFFGRRGVFVVLIGRFVDGLRQASGIVCGLARMRWRRYLAYNALGSTVWVAVWVFAGYLAGSHIAALYAVVSHHAKYLLVGLAVLVVGGLAGWAIKRRANRRAAAEC
ncbi:DedA family protein [Mycobacterium asiaticum]|uniref:DedA family protein n=1 Tax=Mycobacterium asiaticum TaxID=1790 RepID=UPI00055AE17B|nr:DedA family protein [Mycobacterium asiaticum]OBJ53993.1 alkaline phosphatase [Mycobacterium asiaticum]ORA16748.1 alkaline phosphatase [Mycobacterium asiaticum DSM 44297]